MILVNGLGDFITIILKVIQVVKVVDEVVGGQFFSKIKTFLYIQYNIYYESLVKMILVNGLGDFITIILKVIQIVKVVDEAPTSLFQNEF